MKKQYSIEHESHKFELIVVIDFQHPNTLEAIHSMVDFWVGSEYKVRMNDGDYVKTFLQQLANYCFVHLISTGKPHNL